LQRLRRAAQLRELAADAVQIFLRVVALRRRFRGAHIVEQRARHVEEFLVVLDLLGVLEEGTHHPQMSENALQTRNRFLGCHGGVRGAGCGKGAAATAGGDGLAACLVVSASSFEKSTRAAPTPTRMMPTHSFQPGTSTWKWNGSPLRGCQSMLTRVLMTGARPKIKGPM